MNKPFDKKWLLAIVPGVLAGVFAVILGVFIVVLFLVKILWVLT